jgi:membrane associated rhomboid family serine protease
MIPIRDAVKSKTRPFVTWLLIAANIAVFILEIRMPRQQLSALFDQYGVVPSRLAGAELSLRSVRSFYPLFTGMFLHGGWFHLIANMWCLWLFGDNVEDRYGHFRFLLFYLLGGIAAYLVHALVLAGSSTPAIGASGAIAAVMAAYLLMFPRARILTIVPLFFIPLFIQIPAFVFIGLWFVLQLLSGAAALGPRASAAGIAWWAHIGGFMFGIVTLPLFRRREKTLRISRR